MYQASCLVLPCHGRATCPVLLLSTCSGGKLGLSMRDVDQTTGRDLLDLDKIRAAQVGSSRGVCVCVVNKDLYVCVVVLVWAVRCVEHQTLYVCW